MAEVQTTTQSGELTQRFIEFVMMHAQNAALFLGQIPNPQTGQGEVNLEVAKMFIDQLAMIQDKTRGNLSNEEANVLRNAISNLQMVFVEISQNPQAAGATISAEEPPAEIAPETSTSVSSASSSSEKSADNPPSQSAASEGESRKKFTKSYGA